MDNGRWQSRDGGTWPVWALRGPDYQVALNDLLDECFKRGFLLSERHSRSIKMLSMHRPRPAIEIWMPAACKRPVKAPLVNWLPWSVLKISAGPWRASAASRVFDSRQASTCRLAQSMIATRYRHPQRTGM